MKKVYSMPEIKITSFENEVIMVSGVNSAQSGSKIQKKTLGQLQ
jgi:hypothetical protein